MPLSGGECSETGAGRPNFTYGCAWAPHGNLYATSWNTFLLLNDYYAILYCFQTTCENKVVSFIYENILGIFIF
jgi:hypothetical protein